MMGLYCLGRDCLFLNIFENKSWKICILRIKALKALGQEQDWLFTGRQLIGKLLKSATPAKRDAKKIDRRARKSQSHTYLFPPEPLQLRQLTGSN